MKQKLLFLLICLFITSSVNAQFNANPDYRRNGNSLKITQEAGLIPWGYSTDEIEIGVGSSASGLRNAAIYVPASEIAAATLQGNQIRQIRIGLAAKSSKGSIFIRRTLAGENIYTQAMTTTNEGWNTVVLDTPFELDGQNFYIGYQVTGAYCMAFSGTTNKNACWLLDTDGWADYSSQDWGSLCIQLLVGGNNLPQYESAVSSVVGYAAVNQAFTIKAAVKNNAEQTVTNIKFEYQINDETPIETTASTSIESGKTVVVDVPADAVSTFGEYTLKLTLLEINGHTDENSANNSATGKLKVFSSLIPRVVLHESFTSSTCGPCYAGNQNLLAVLNAVDESKWANIRYQMSWPSTGDPYYTAEGGSKRTFYGINSVPDLEVDGVQWNGNPAAYSTAIFNQASAIPASADLVGNATVVGKTVNATIAVTPVTNQAAQNLRIFAAVAEKTTSKNKKSNGETLFHNVMKKFLTDVNGNPIANLEVGTPQSFDYSYTFQGNYRLPTAAVNNSNQYIGINHATEHSVENFDNLIVVYWVQNIATGEVLQAGKAIAPQNVGIPNIEKGNTLAASIHDGLLHIQSAVPVQKTEIYTIAGQRVLSQAVSGNTVAVDRLTTGVYIVKVKTAEGEKAIKVIK